MKIKPGILVDKIYRDIFNHFMEESTKNISVDELDNGRLAQTIELKAHQASKREVRKYLKDQEETK